MKKVLIVATVVKQHIMVFHLPLIEMLKKNGYEVHVAAKNDYENKEDCKIPYCDKFFDINFARSPFSYQNVSAYKKLRCIIRKYKYEYVHCNTPVGGLIGRLACKTCKESNPKVLYTAHGFHFFRGSAIKNWLFYYPVEKYMSRFTDVLFTINQEDYELSQKKFYAKENFFIPGVGINTKDQMYSEEDYLFLDNELKNSSNYPVLLSVGELNDNKNHIFVIKELAKIKEKDFIYFICGSGPNKAKLQRQIDDLRLTDKIKLLGYRNDVDLLMKKADIFIFPSKREGLPVSVMEAMNNGLPCIVSDIRGNRDLITEGENGLLFHFKRNDFLDKVVSCIDNVDLRRKLGESGKEQVAQYSTENILLDMEKIYLEK